MIFSLWPSMIQFHPPNHVQKTNQKNLHISAGKHPFDTSEVLQACQLLCLETQTSEYGSKGSFITSDLRVSDVEVIPQRGLQRWHVPNHLRVGKIEPLSTSWGSLKLRCCRRPWSRRAWETRRAWALPTSRDSPKLRCLPDHIGVAGGRASPTSWDSSRRLTCHPRPRCRSEVEEPAGPWAIFKAWMSTRDLGVAEVEVVQVRQFAEARIQGAGELSTVPPQPDLHHFAVLPRWLRGPPDVVEGPTEVVSADRFLSQVLLCLKILRFYFSIFPKVGYSYPPRNHPKTIERFATLQVKSPYHSFHVVQVRELRLCQSQRHQDLLQRRLLATWLRSLHRFASDIHSFAEAAVQLRLQSRRFS